MVECTPFLSWKFEVALQLASGLHHKQCRKGTNIPYVSHLLAVASLVLEAGGDEELVIVALLHDAVEDQGGEPTLDMIQRLFGDRVAGIVRECSDTDREPKPPWHERKEQYLKHLQSASRDALLVPAADKLHNARAILADYRQLRDRLWERFNATRADELWYYGKLREVFCQRAAEVSVVQEFARVVEHLEREVANQSS